VCVVKNVEIFSVKEEGVFSDDRAVKNVKL
jgi:hypothetical protein